jgi:hypothetical protein
MKEILVDSNHKLFNKDNMFYKEFNSDIRQIRFYTLLIIQNVPNELNNLRLLEQQICELITNAIKHGNKKNINKKVKVWYSFTNRSAHLIIEDEGEGFKNLEEWNIFNKERNKHYKNNNIDKMKDYLSYRTENSDENDGGNALFAAVEYWDGGMIFNDAKNAVAVYKEFPIKKDGFKINKI